MYMHVYVIGLLKILATQQDNTSTTTNKGHKYREQQVQRKVAH